MFIFGNTIGNKIDVTGSSPSIKKCGKDNHSLATLKHKDDVNPFVGGIREFFGGATGYLVAYVIRFEDRLFFIKLLSYLV